MVKRNPGPATMPNAAIDLTSLLDVIFIFLFFIILAYSKLASQQEAPQPEYNEPAITEHAYKESLVHFKELDKIVKKITVYCNYDHNDPTKRTIKVLTSNDDPFTISLSKEKSNTGFNQLKEFLSEYIEKNMPKEQSDENGSASTDGASFIVIFLSLNEIQRGDREKIDEIATDFMNRYDNVYYRKTRTD